MRIARLALPDGPAYARLQGTQAHPLTAAPWEGGEPDGPPVAWTEGMLLAPVLPYKILCVGRNYAAHARELGNEVPKEPLLFLKPKSALAGPGGRVLLPPQSERVEHEAELGVVIGETMRRVAPERALAHVFGYTCTCDVTARDLQRKDGQWSRAKGFDTFCPAGPWVETDFDPSAARIRCRVNGQARQDGTTADMTHGVAALLSFMSEAMTLEPGDLILTGTPEGVGPLADGDALEVEIDGIGTLAVAVAADRPPSP